MIPATIACPFTAQWTEGVVGHGRKPSEGDDGETIPQAAQPTPWRNAPPPDESPGNDVIVAARDRGLPSTYDPRGMSIPHPLPLLVEHTGEVAGYAYSVIPSPDGLVTVTGFAYRERFLELARFACLSPGLVGQDGEVIETAAGPVLYVTRCDLVEISATNTPSREGTRFQIEAPRRLTDRETFAVETAERFSAIPEETAFGVWRARREAEAMAR